MSHERDTTSIPVERGGGKLESQQTLAKMGFPVPKSEYLYFEDLKNQNLVKAALRNLRPPYIVRGSHPNDWQGYIDVLPTFRNTSTLEGVNYAISEIVRVAASEVLARHAADWDQPFTPEVHILLQEQSPSPLVGSMLRHPHILGQIDINYVDIEAHNNFSNLGARPAYSYSRLWENGHVSNHSQGEPVSDQDIKIALKFYEQVESSGLIDPDWVYQMEIGFNPFLIYQLRPFKKKEPVKKFDLPHPSNVKTPYLHSELVFGITPPEGLELQFLTQEFEDLLYATRSLPTYPHGLIITTQIRDSVPNNLNLCGLMAIASLSNVHQYLEHGDYRLLKRARFGLLGYFSSNVEIIDGETDYNVFHQSRLYSNGEDGIIIPS